MASPHEKPGGKRGDHKQKPRIPVNQRTGADAVFKRKPVNKQGEKRLDHRPAGAQKRAFVHFFQIGLSQQVNLPPVVTVFPKDRKQARFGPAAGLRALRNSGQQKHNLPFSNLVLFYEKTAKKRRDSIKTNLFYSVLSQCQRFFRLSGGLYET